MIHSPQEQQPSDANLLYQRICSTIVHSLDAGSLLPAITEIVGKWFGADICLLGVASKSNWKASTLGAADSEREIQPIYTYTSSPVDESDFPDLTTWQTPMQEDPLVVCDLQQLQQQYQEKFAKTGQSFPRGILATKTQFQGQENGVVVLMKFQPYSWKDEEIDSLKMAADRIAIAIFQMQVQRQTTITTQYQSIIADLTKAVHNSWQLEDIFQLAIEGVLKVLQMEQGEVLLLKYTTPQLSTVRHGSEAAGIQDPAFPTVEAPQPSMPQSKATVVGSQSSRQKDRTWVDTSFTASDCYWCQQAYRQAPEVLAIADQRPILRNHPQRRIAPIFNPHEFPALALVPLVGAQNEDNRKHPSVLGFMALQHAEPRGWRTDELDFLQLIAAQLSTAIIHNQTLTSVQALVEKRTAQLQRSLEVQAKLYEQTRKQVDQLRRLNQLKDEFVDTMSHELKTPLTSMQLAIRMLRQPNLPPERQALYLDILEKQCHQESKLVNDVLTLQRYESQQVELQNLQWVDLASTLQEEAAEFQQKWQQKGLNLDVAISPNPLYLHTEAENFQRILSELLVNAGKYSDKNTTAELKVSSQMQDGTEQVVLQVTNYGDGIAEEDLPHIFEKFRRGQGVTQQAVAGTGLGLTLVKCLVEHLDGSITVSSSPCQDQSEQWQTCFTVTLPQLREKR
jgi:signal transduction histidine kinase